MFLVVILAFFLWARAGHSICRNGFTKKNFVQKSDNVRFFNYRDKLSFLL